MTTNPIQTATNGAACGASAIVPLHWLRTMKTLKMNGKDPYAFLRTPWEYYRGFKPSAASVIPFYAFSFAVESVIAGENRLQTSLMAATISSVHTTVFERVMIRQQLTGDSFLDTVGKIYRQTCYRGFLKGYPATVVRDAPLFAAARIGNPSAPEKLAWGFVIAFLTLPADVIKTKMQSDLAGEYPTILKTAQHVINTRGVRGLWVAWQFRSAYGAGLTFLVSTCNQKLSS